MARWNRGGWAMGGWRTGFVWMGVALSVTLSCCGSKEGDAGAGRVIAAAPTAAVPSAVTLTVGPDDAMAIEATLAAAKARVNTITSDAEAMVRRIEAKPPDRLMLLRLDATFTDTRRLMVTDERLAALGDALPPAGKATVRHYTKARYEALKKRVAAAGHRHRAAQRKAILLRQKIQEKPAKTP